MKTITFTTEELDYFLDKAEKEVSDSFPGTAYHKGNGRCPICFFRARLKTYLNIGASKDSTIDEQ